MAGEDSPDRRLILMTCVRKPLRKEKAVAACLDLPPR